MIKIIADDKIPFLKGVLEPYAQVKYLPGAKTTANEVIGVDSLITRTRTKCNADLLKESAVKMIATATIGFDHIDVDFCKKNNIKWTNAPGCNSGSVKQYIASALAHLCLKQGKDLSSLTIGIVGVGNVGKKIKDLAEAFGMNVLLNDPPRANEEGEAGFVSLQKIQQEADIITFHVPLIRKGDDKTFHLGNEEFFSNCSKKPVIINSSRGEVLCNESLLKAIEKKQLAEVILDVWENEPNINIELLNKTIISTPHIAGYSVDGKANGTSMSVQALAKHFNLPLKDWYPENLPKPENPIIELDAKSLNVQSVLSKAIMHTYNINDDSLRLRNSVETFEEQRGSYPQRREFQAYTIKLINGSAELRNSLLKIGFQHIESSL